MTRDEFERAYAERSKVSVDELRELGGEVVPCECGESGCCGWWMKTQPDPEESER